ncbi:hypothetical protein [Pseudomonas sp.]|uniref:hypothetical protein n=1 Tax=Pseudomonas sp. TaxID=306 RepID=UPI0025840305|nr:hypothetical protein [Pseudomonas sp.]
MAITDDRTPRLNLPLPVKTNALKDDVERLREAFGALDTKVATVDDNGKIPVDQIPAVAITDTFAVNTQAAMLALDAQPGDVAIRSDISKTFILMAAPATTLSNWKELINDALVQLNTSDGFKYVGKCHDISSLRTAEPSSSYQSIILERAVSDGPILNEILTYDPTDTTSADDGYSVFVTAGGKRWKTDETKPINAFMGGFSPSLNNLAQVINAIALNEVAKVIARGSVAGGVREIEVPHLPNSMKTAGRTVFTMTATVRTPTFLTVKLPRQAKFQWRKFVAGTSTWEPFDTGNGWIVSNEFTGLTQSMMFSSNGGETQGASAAHMNVAIEGNGAIFAGPGYNLTTYYACRLGNVTAPSGTYAHCRDATVRGIHFAGWAAGASFGHIDTYICTYDHCVFTRNLDGFVTTVGGTAGAYQWANSGENMLLNRCIIGDNYRHAIRRNDRGHFITYRNCSLDYNASDLFHYDADAIGEDIVEGGHFEGVGGLIANMPAQNAADGQCNLIFNGSKEVSQRSGSDTYKGVRNIAWGVSNRLNVEFNNVRWLSAAPYVGNAYGMWKDMSDASNQCRVSGTYPAQGQTYRYMFSISDRLNNTFTFAGAAGDPIPVIRNATGFWCVKTGASTCVIGSSADADADGYIPVAITLTAATESVQLLYGKPLYFGRDLKQLFGKCSVKVANATGNVNVQTCARVMNKPTLTAPSGGGAVTESDNLAAIPTGVTQDVINSLSKDSVKNLVTNNDYMATYPAPVSLVGGEFCYMGLRFTGFVGTIYVKLPLWYFPDDKNSAGYL